jgi:hypothetical protein
MTFEISILTSRKEVFKMNPTKGTECSEKKICTIILKKHTSTIIMALCIYTLALVLWVVVPLQAGETVTFVPDLIATTNRGELIEIDLDTGTTGLIGDAGFFDGREPGWTGLSFDSKDKLFVTSRRRGEPISSCFGVYARGSCAHLYRVDPSTGAILREVGSTEVAFLSDIDFAPDDTLYGNRYIDERQSNDGGLIVIDKSTAETTAAIGRFGAWYYAGDLENGGLSVHPITGDVWAIESSFSSSPSIFRVDPETGFKVGADRGTGGTGVVRLGLDGEPTTFGFDSLEITVDGRFFATKARGHNELYEINPTPDKVSGLAEITLIPLELPEIEGSLSGLESLFQGVEVHVDIKPNTINLTHRKNYTDKKTIPIVDLTDVAVVILSSDDFDTTNVDLATITLSGAHIKLKRNGEPMVLREDLNGDRLPDLLVHVSSKDLLIGKTSTVATLYGRTFDGRYIRGSDAIKVVY